jgi:hypothetical protein
LLIETVPDLIWSGELAAGLMALQWTKLAGSATLHCNVDHGAACRLLISSSSLN